MYQGRTWLCMQQQACCIACMGQLLPVLSWPPRQYAAQQWATPASWLCIITNGVTWWECDIPLLYVSSGAPLDGTLCALCVLSVWVCGGVSSRETGHGLPSISIGTCGIMCGELSHTHY